MKNKFPKLDEVLFQDKHMNKNALSAVRGGRGEAQPTVTVSYDCFTKRTTYDADVDPFR